MRLVLSVLFGVQRIPRLQGKEGLSAIPKLAAVPISPPRLDPVDILTPEELAQRLKVRVRWVYEAVHGRNPLPCLHCGRYLRFSWPDVVAWMRNGKG